METRKSPRVKNRMGTNKKLKMNQVPSRNYYCEAQGEASNLGRMQFLASSDCVSVPLSFQ